MLGAQTEPEDSVIQLPLSDGTLVAVSATQSKRWEQLYPAVNVMQELRKMAGWLEASPNRRKTKQGILRFVANWLAREQDSGGTRTAPASEWWKKRNPALRYQQREVVDPDEGVDWL